MVQIDDRDASASPTTATTATTASTASSRSWRSWSWRRWRVSKRVFAVALIPLVTASALSGWRVLTSADGVREREREATAVRLVGDLAVLAHDLEAERDLTARHLTSPSIGLDLGEPRLGVDERMRQIPALGSTLREVAGSTLERRVLAIETLPDRLLVMRDAIDDERAPAPSSAVFRAYGEMVDAVLTGMEQLTSVSGDPNFTERMRVVVALASAEAAGSRERALIAIGLQQGSLDVAEQAELDRATADRRSAVASFLLTADEEERQAYADTVTGGDVDESERIRVLLTNQLAGLTAGKNSRTTTVSDPSDWYAVATRANNLVLKVRIGVEDTMRAEVEERRASALRDAYLQSALLILLLATTITITVAVARSITRPLHSLRKSALTVADQELPETVQRLEDGEDDPDVITVHQVPVGPPDEIGEVARAFGAVHVEAVRLATAQARLRASVNAMFVNLARRNHGLVERQLQLIDELESAERDPDQLENLFRLDHLATRMRRHGEGLLVLAGDRGARSRRAPGPLLDIARAALAEVEGYKRVDVEMMPDALIVGGAVNDLVHLLAELIENALRYSNGESRVRVGCRFNRLGDPLIEVLDSGLGLKVSTLQEINEQLADPPPPDVRTSRQMGLFVVARLAARHGMEVSLRPRVTVGTVAHVVIPPALVVSGVHSSAAGQPPSHALGAPLTPELTDPMPSSAPTPEPLADRPDGLLQDPFAPVVAQTPIFEAMEAARIRRWAQEWRQFADEGTPATEPSETVQHEPPAGTERYPTRPSAGSERQQAPAAPPLRAGDLPIRTPGENLKPGALPVHEPSGQGLSASPDALRARLSGFQRGLQQGRRNRGSRPAEPDTRPT